MTKAKFKKAFPKQLLDARKDRGFTQSDLANRTGLTQDWLSHFENGRRLPDAYSFWRLQSVLGDFVASNQ